MRCSLISLVSMAAILFSTPAAAQSDSTPPTGKQAGPRNRGLMITGAFGVTGCYNDACSSADADPLVGFETTALIRFHRNLAAGATLAFGFGLPDDESNISTKAFWSMVIGPDFRGILPVLNDRLEIWGNFVMGYGRSAWDFDATVLGRTYKTKTWANSFAVGWGGGVNFFLTENIAMGASISHYRMFPRKACGKSGNLTECDKLTSNERKFFLGWWGLMGVFTYFLPF